MPEPDSPPPLGVALDRGRYRALRRYLVGAILHLLWWDGVMARPLLRRLRPAPRPRWRRLAREYRELAVAMGGVLIKLGQFLSTRVDLLPPEVTDELAGLQDEVPPAPFAAVRAAIEEDLGAPLDQLFAAFGEQAVGAASLAQVHAATLPGGDRVVVKVLRPGIERLVATDLAAIRAAARWLRLSRPLRRRLDIGRLLDEFERVTRFELDLEHEGKNAERFAAAFAGEEDVLVPAIHWSHSGRRTLALENVAALKIDDLDALVAAGIDPGAVARRLWELTLSQLLDHHLVHADPHPGNLFVHPRGTPLPPGKTGRAFALAFVDFGMMIEIPPRLREALGEHFAALGTRDAGRLVASYQMAGVLLPGADLAQIEELQARMFDELWGVPIGDLPGAALARSARLLPEYRELIFNAPFQFPVDLLFAGRAVGLLSGLATRLDPAFDPWEATRPTAARLIRRELDPRRPGALLDGLSQLVALLRLPRDLGRAAGRLERGSVVVRAEPGKEARRLARRLERGVHRLGWTMIACTFLLLAGLGYLLDGEARLVVGALAAAAVAFLWSRLAP